MNEIRLRNLQQGEDITDLIPEIIQAFEQQKADVVHFTSLNGEHFQVNLFDFNVYSALSVRVYEIVVQPQSGNFVLNGFTRKPCYETERKRIVAQFFEGERNIYAFPPDGEPFGYGTVY